MNNLPKLVNSSELADIQNTEFSADALGRYLCSTWQEATQNGGPAFGAVVIGSGMYGAYLAESLFQRSAAGNFRVLVLEAGPFLVSEHVQNLARIGLNVPSAIHPYQDSGKARDVVWGIPWRGFDHYPGLAYCVGGKSLYWGGWCPRLTSADLIQWPPVVAQHVQSTYPTVEDETGVLPTTDFISGALFQTLMQRFQQVAPTVSNLAAVEEAPLAVQGEPPASGLFSFDKFSSAPILADAIRQDAANSNLDDSQRRLFLVPRAHVVKLHTAQGVVTTLEVGVQGQRHFLNIAPNCAVVLCASAIESTRLALLSFPSPLMGRNLMAHLRSDFTVRIKRTAFGPLPADLETAALLVRGTSGQGRFHIQVTASASRKGFSEELLFRMIPDIDERLDLLASQDADFITVTLRGVGEIQGDRNTPVPNGNSWINLSHDFDEFGVQRAWVQFGLRAADVQLWNDMDQATLALAQAVAGQASNIEYFYDGTWQTQPYPLNRPFPEWHRGLGTTYHESGTLWMGGDASSSVTNTNGRFHHIQNAYACDQSIFPTVGSANPVLTGLALARRVAAAIVP